jgi:hypothetical protein
MFGIHLFLPFITMVVGALFATMINGGSMYVGGAIGFGIGCAIVAVVWLFFAILNRFVE